jgi:hypothetical protein
VSSVCTADAANFGGAEGFRAFRRHAVQISYIFGPNYGFWLCYWLLDEP